MCLYWRVKVHILLYEHFILIFSGAKRMRSRALRQRKNIIRCGFPAQILLLQNERFAPKVNLNNSNTKVKSVYRRRFCSVL